MMMGFVAKREKKNELLGWSFDCFPCRLRVKRVRPFVPVCDFLGLGCLCCFSGSQTVWSVKRLTSLTW